MKKVLSLFAIVALGVLMSCSGSSPTAPAVPTPTADTWGVSALTAQPAQALVGETVTITATITKNGSAAPDGTGVAFTYQVESGTGGGFFQETSSSTVNVSTQGGKATVHFYSATESNYSIQAKVQSVSHVVTVSYSSSEPLALYGVVPNQGAQTGGETVNLAGTGFTENLHVEFNVSGLGTFEAAVASVSADHHSALVTTPVLTGADPTQEYVATVNVSLPGVADGAQLPQAFRFVPSSGEPEIYSVYPAQGSSRGGDQVVVYGRDFVSPVQVSFGTDLGTVDADEISLSADGTQISLVTPPLSAEDVQGDHPAAVTVRTAVGSANEKTTTKQNAYVFLADHPEPQITAVAPTSGPLEGGTQVTIFGSGFEFPVQVTFGDREANVVDVSYDQIICRSPDYTPTGLTPPVTVDVTVRNVSSGLTSTLAGAYTYGESMFISGNSPSQGSAVGGTQVTIFGSGFRAPLTVVWIPGSGSATGIPLSVTSVSGNQVVAVTDALDPVPCDDTTGIFRITQLDSGIQVEGGTFTYNGQDLTIYNPSPSSGANGDSITVYGKNFAVADANEPVQVSFGDLSPQTAFFPDAGNLDVFKVTVPDTSSIEFDTVACTVGTIEGVQNVPTAVDLTVKNMVTGCEDTLVNGFTIVPDDQSCQLPPANISVTPTQIDFPDTTNGSCSTPVAVVISNTGGQDLTVSNISYSSSVFLGGGGAVPQTIAGGGSWTFSVQFCPTAVQTYSGSVTIASDDPDTPTLTVPVSGTGTAAP